MKFGAALVLLENGFSVTREGWNGVDMYVTAQFPDENSKMTLPYLYMYTAQEDLVPWVVSHSDMFEDDWILMEE